MALLFVDSFDHYVTADLMQKWTQSAGNPSFAPTITASVGRRSTQAVRWTNTNNALAGKTLLKVLAPSDDTCIVGFAFTAGTLGFSDYDTGTSDDPNVPTGTNGLLYIRNLGVTHVWLRINTNGTISAYKNTTLLTTTTVALSLGVTAYIECKVLVHDSTGTVDININGASAAPTFTGDTQNGGTAGWDEVGIGHISAQTNSGTWDYDDLYVCDGAGGTSDNFLGDLAIDVLRPNATGTYNDSTPSTGTDRYALVDDTTANGDTDYNTVAAVNDEDSFNFPTAPVAGADILGVQVCLQARLPSGGTSGLKATARVNSTDYAGSEHAVGGSYSVFRQIWDLNPDDSAAWEDTDINAAEFGYIKSS